MEVELPNQLILSFKGVKFKSQRSFLDFFINQEISTLTFPSPMFTSKTIDFDIMRVELPHSLVIELDPFCIGFFYITEIVPKLCTTIVQNDTLQDEFVVIGVSLAFLLVYRVVIDVKILGEFQPRIELLVLEFIVVEADSLEVNDEVVWYFGD